MTGDLRLERRALTRAVYCQENHDKDIQAAIGILTQREVQDALFILSFFDSRVHREIAEHALEDAMAKLQSATEWEELRQKALVQAEQQAWGKA